MSFNEVDHVWVRISPGWFDEEYECSLCHWTKMFDEHGVYYTLPGKAFALGYHPDVSIRVEPGCVHVF